MSKLTPPKGKKARPPEADSFQPPLARVLNGQHLASLVPQLAPETLHALIRHHGLHACGALVAAATPQQLTSVFDLDWWRHAEPGQNEQLDADRFGDWLEVLVDIGADVAARIIAAQDRDLIVAALSRFIRVRDPAAIVPSGWSDDDELIDRAQPGEGPDRQLGGYLARAIRADAWDAVVTMLLALEADHRDCFDALMRGCRRLSNSAPEVDGLDDLLPEPEQVLHDAAVNREDRQSQRGYSTPADARAFLQMARDRQPRKGTGRTNPIAAAYFRATEVGAATTDATSPSQAALTPSTGSGSAHEAVDALLASLAEAGIVAHPPRALLEEPQFETPRLMRIRGLLDYLVDADADTSFQRSRELAFVANTLMAGCSIQSRPFTAQEASDAAVAICNLGLEHWPAGWPGAETPHTVPTAAAGPGLPDDFLKRHDLVTAFEVGWAVLYEQVSLSVSDQLIATLKGLRYSDAEIRHGLVRLRRELMSQRKAGTPWRARGALDVLMMLDMPAWASLVGLLDECPVLPEALTAIMQGRTRAVSAITFDFISTTAQVDAVRGFMKRLPVLLGA